MLILFLASLFFLTFWPTSAYAAIYKYIDKNGTIHFTDRYESIPPEYRNQIKTIKEEPSPQAPAQPAEEKEESGQTPPKDQSKIDQGAEQKKKEEEVRKAAQEGKLKAQQDKMKRIEELNKQINAKQEEIKSLRTTWMVYDRINMNRLSQEIEDLKKEVQSIQEALTEERK